MHAHNDPIPVQLHMGPGHHGVAAISLLGSGIATLFSTSEAAAEQMQEITSA